MQDPNRPLGSFIFLGPTGVGKTELARALAEFLFDDEHAMIRIDMSEYQEKHTVSRLLGAPPGYVGYEEAGQLTEAVRRRPYSVVLFDEIEKAHPEVLNVLLQLLDDGRLTDGKGRTIDFKNTVVIMTSNLGSAFLADLGDRGIDEGVRRQVMDALRAHFRPEFINRVDEIIVFHPLSREQMKTIIDIQVKGLLKRLEERKIFVVAHRRGEGMARARRLRPGVRRAPAEARHSAAHPRSARDARARGRIPRRRRRAGRRRARRACSLRSSRPARSSEADWCLRRPEPPTRVESAARSRAGPPARCGTASPSSFLLVLAQTYFLVPAGRQIPYSEFKSLVAQGKVAEATVGEQIIRGTLKPADANAKPEPFVTTRIEDPSLVAELEKAGVKYTRRADEPVAARAVELDHSPAAPCRRSGASSSGRWAAPKAA